LTEPLLLVLDLSANYHSFLIRLWKIKQEDVFVWRASLENPQTGEVLGFENLRVLFKYLETLTIEKEDED